MEQCPSTGGLLVALSAPIASWRDPLFAGVVLRSEVPAPSMLSGLLAAAVGSRSLHSGTAVGIWFTAGGSGTDYETYHPLNTKGTRLFAGEKGGPRPAERPFLSDVTIELLIVGPHRDQFERAVRQPVWPLRLGRSQDLMDAPVTRSVTVRPATAGSVQGALIPAGAVELRGLQRHRLPVAVSTDRARTDWGDFVYTPKPAVSHDPAGAYQIPGEDRLWWPIPLRGA